MTDISTDKIREALEGLKDKATRLLDDDEKVEGFLGRLEEKLRQVPKAGEILGDVPLMIAMVRSYIRKQYNDVPRHTIIAVTAALLYVFLPVDLIPDAIPVVGLLDDAAVIAFVVSSIHDDLAAYKRWQLGKKTIVEAEAVEISD